MSDLEFNFSNASVFEKKFKTRQIFIEKFYKASRFGLKKIRPVIFWIEKFWTRQVLKNCLHPRNHVLVHINPWKWLILHFCCFSKEHDFELEISKRVRFWFKLFTTRQIWDWKKYIFKVVLNASFFHFQKIQHVRFSVKILQPLRDELNSGSFQLYIRRLKLQQTLSFNFLPQNNLFLTLTEKSSFNQNLKNKIKLRFRRKEL